MQSLAREGLTAAEVTSILTANALDVTAGCELLAPDLSVIEDISDDFGGGTVEHVFAATVHRTCNLEITRPLAWGTALVGPYMRLTGEGLAARFNCGVFSLTTPDRVIGCSLETYSVTGYDRLYFLDRPVGDTHTVQGGVGYLDAVRSVIAAAGLSGVLLDGSASAVPLPATRTWPLLPEDSSGSTTWLGIVNDLLEAIGYRGLWCDESGRFRSEPYVNPRERSPEYAFDADSLRTIVGQERTHTNDVYKTPNRWVFSQQSRGADAAPATFGAPVAEGGWVRTPGGDGLYRVDHISGSPTAQTERGLVWAAPVTQIDVADQATLVSQGEAAVAADLRVSEVLAVTTGPFPAAGHADVFEYADAALGSTRKVTASRWTLDLGGADMTWTWDVVS